MSQETREPLSTRVSRLRARPIDRLCRRIVLKRLEALRVGCIRILEGDEALRFGRQDRGWDLEVKIRVHHPRFYSLVLTGGSAGGGEAYLSGLWDADDLPGVIRVLVLNRHLLEQMAGGVSQLQAPLLRLFHRLNRNTLRGSLRNISAHYDLGNDFFSLFLDETLTYSCGIFESPSSSLREASEAKYDRLCRKLRLAESDHVLEIGTGWGGFALHAAGRYGCRVTTTTLSEEQLKEARRRVQDAGLSDRVTLLLQDYRRLEGEFDKLVSIEMIEAVGHEFLPAFFRACSDRLKPDGMMGLQAITIQDQVYRRHVRTVDFIKRYIFPGSTIPSVAAMAAAVARASQLKIFHLEDITLHYARTLREWRLRLMARGDEVLALGHSAEFLRMWEFYLAYCEGAFQERYLGDVQIILTKPLCRRAPILGELDTIETA